GKRLGVSEDYLATGTERHDENAVLVEAEINLRLDERDEAAKLYGEALRQATTSDEQARALAGLGQPPYRAGKPPEAIARLEEARAVGRVDLADYPSWADTLGRSYALVDQLDAAASLFESSLNSAEQRH